jgi:hypothetical protein
MIRYRMIAWGIKWKSFVVFQQRLQQIAGTAVISVVERNDHEEHAYLLVFFSLYELMR